MPVDPSILETAPVKYSDARADIKNGDIALFSGNEFFSKLIQKFTDGPFSHVGFVWRTNDVDRVMLLESVDHLGVRLIPLSVSLNGTAMKPVAYTGKLVIARHSDFPPDIQAGEALGNPLFQQMTEYALDRVGAPYSTGDIIDIATRIMVGFVGVKEATDLLPQSSFICSEYAYECYKSMGIDIPFDSEKFIAPNDFARAAEVSAVLHVCPD